MDNMKRFEQPDGFNFPKHFTNADGKEIRYGYAQPKKKAIATVILTTGYADFTESYFETINDFLDKGYAVWMMDWQGQGGSERYHGDRRLPSKHAPMNNIRDLHQFRHDIVAEDKNIPIFVASHSMGGHMVMHYMNNHEDDFHAAVLPTPYIDTSFTKNKERLIHVFAKVACNIGFGHYRMSRGDNIVRKIKKIRHNLQKDEPVRMTIHKHLADKNPDLKIGDPTLHWILSMLKQAIKLRPKAVLENIKTPTLFAICENDRLVNKQAIKRAAKLMPNANLVEIKDGHHGIWTERQHIREIWWESVDSFLSKQIVDFHSKQHNKSQNNVKKNPKPPAMGSR